MKKIIICDIDGTIADCNHRRHYVENGNKDWDSFYNAMSEDKPKEDIIEILKSIKLKILFSEVIFFTGRPKKYLDKTRLWLLDNLKNSYMDFSAENIFMREDGDYRPDDIVKKELFEKSGINKEEILCVFDDRDRVVKMWREMGLTCLQVADGNF